MNEPTPARSRSGLALIGYRGTGKTSAGRILARKLGRSFVDADAALEARTGLTVRSIFEEWGEPVFRDWEERELAIQVNDPNKVLATGGGVVLREANRQALRRFGFIVWLTAGIDTLKTRLLADARSASGRPSLTSAGTLDEIAQVLEMRRPLYGSLANVEVPTDDRSPAEVAEAVFSVLPDQIFQAPHVRGRKEVTS